MKNIIIFRFCSKSFCFFSVLYLLYSPCVYGQNASNETGVIPEDLNAKSAEEQNDKLTEQQDIEIEQKPLSEDQNAETSMEETTINEKISDELPREPLPLQTDITPSLSKENTAALQKSPRPRISRGLLIGGGSTLGGGYLFSALVGMLLVSEVYVEPGETCVNCQSAGRPMFIPIVGPFIAAPHADRENGGPAVAVTMGLVQVAGLAIFIAGLIKYSKSKKALNNWKLQNSAL